MRGTVSDGAQFQQISDIVGRFNGTIVSLNGKDDKAVIINAVTISQNLAGLQRAIANISGASDIRVDPDGKGNVIVSGNATDAVTAQAILDRARGLAGPYLASNGQLIDRLNSLSNSQIDIKVYVLEVDKTAQSNLGLSLQSASLQPGDQPHKLHVERPVVPSRRIVHAAGKRSGLHGSAVLPHADARADAESHDARRAREGAIESEPGYKPGHQGHVLGRR